MSKTRMREILVAYMKALLEAPLPQNEKNYLEEDASNTLEPQLSE